MRRIRIPEVVHSARHVHEPLARAFHGDWTVAESRFEAALEHVTDAGILSTVRHGADADYPLVVVKDGFADRDEEVHRVLMEKLFVRQATVVSASEVTAALEKS